ncbi:MAG: 7-cyano-7-deazaguanine synthase [Myxacorys californica WJT36-NPBG1]|jgi:7-cyano-7-deazaguanine synthase in queuosine biosynthesis|nr:7-cyano-7-deazaguanine synthase [Myxacorys californica WJT36-NPBG1]
MSASKAIVLLSGGLDSSTSAAQAITDGYELIALSLHYGQRHDRELIAAKRVAEHLGIKEHFVVDVNLAQWGGSALTDQAIEPIWDLILKSQALQLAGFLHFLAENGFARKALPLIAE